MPVETCSVSTLHVCTQQIYRLLFYFLGAPNQGASVICESQGLNANEIFSNNVGIPLANPLSAASYAHLNISFPQMIYHTHCRFWIPRAHGVSSNAFDIWLLTCTHSHILDKYMKNISQREHFYEPQRHTSHGTVFHWHYT